MFRSVSTPWCRRRERINAAGVALAVMLTGCGGDPPPPARFVEGDELPSFALETLDGATVALDSFGARVIVLNVWATWCGPCRRELPSLERLARQLDPQRFAVIGLSVDTDDHLVREYLIDQKIGLTSYIDRERRVARDTLGVTVYPDTFVIAPGRRYVHHVVGDRVWDTPAMVEALEAVHAGRGAALLRAASAPAAR